jgi:PAS domain-containing protein
MSTLTAGRIPSHAMRDVIARPALERLRADFLQEDCDSYEPLSGLLSTLLGLALRGYLINHDRECLDSFGEHNTIVFMLQGIDWLHPDDLPLFDYELIEAAVSICGDAVVTHRYQPSHRDPDSWYTVMTAVLNPAETIPWVLGMLGPEDRSGADNRQNRFADVVASIRKAMPDLMRVADAARTALADDEPVIVVDQKQGIVLHANQSARQLADWQHTEPIGAPFEDVAGLLQLYPSGGRLAIRQMLAGPLAVSLVGVPLGAGEPSPDGRDTVESLTDELNDALSDLCESIVSLKTHVSSANNAVALSLLNRIDSQTISVRKGVEHLMSIATNTSPAAEDLRS